MSEVCDLSLKKSIWQLREIMKKKSAWDFSLKQE